MKVKICGIRSDSDLAMAIKAGADAVGFITDVPVDSPRKIGLDEASRLIARVPVFVTAVLVIMPENADKAIKMIHAAKPDAVQVHNSLPVDDLIKIKRTGVRLIKTIHVSLDSSEGMILDMISDLSGITDAVLLDTVSGGITGGTGVTHNWELSSGIVQKAAMPVILAGGLNPGNVIDAVKSVRPYAVDTASGVETAGKKDEQKVIDFIRNARMYEI